MDSSVLAQKMLEWEALKTKADCLGKEIEATVLKIGKTQNVGNVRVTYSKGRRKFDYMTSGEVASPEVIEAHTETKTVTNTDWKAVCVEAGIEPSFMQAEPSARIKLV